jgi:putative ABC transport system permease protein
MIRHTFKLIWNRKGRNAMLMGEVFLAFVVMFIVCTALISGLTRYLKPLGFEYKNRWVLFFNRGGLDSSAGEELRSKMARVREELLSLPDVESVSFLSGNYPYSHSTWSTGFDWNGQSHHEWVWLVDDDFARTAGLTVLEGRWFNHEDDASPRRAIVLTRQMKDELFGDESPIGQIQADEDRDEERVIVGVVDDYRYKGELEACKPGFFERHIVTDTASELGGQALIAVRPGSDARVEQSILQRLNTIAPVWNMRIETLADRREDYLKGNFVSAGIFVSIAGFLVFNVALGLFGVLWQSISHRHGEVGLRRAVGATKRNIAGQVLLEMLAMTTVAIALGIFVAVQVPALRLDSVLLGLETAIPGGVYLLAMVCAAAMIYIIVSLCAFYPSHLAAQIEPAPALHEE